MRPSVAHRDAQDGLGRHQVGREAERAQERGEVLDALRPVEVADMLEDPGPVEPFAQACKILCT